MIKWLYKRIIRRLDLSKDQLRELKSRLTPESICKGPFVQGERNCPNTTALAIKEGVSKFTESDKVRGLLRKYGISGIELWAFYLVFDIPSTLSDGFFESSIKAMKRVVNELIQEQKPEFKPKPGQIDYTDIKRAPVINCVVQYQDKILIVLRNSEMKFYPGYWNGISGFLDDDQSIGQKAKNEIKEETGIGEENIVSIKEGKVFEQDEPKYNKTWIVHPVLVEVNTDKVELDWEAESYKWTRIEEAKNFKLLPSFDRVLEALYG
ncbi:MAG: NUDIX domain-containing protein [Patescibacteria group bacterium]|nr:NUDIX domain-containing protein [Patescibacteria group bacterium]